MRVGASGWSIQVHPQWDAEEALDRILISAAEEGGDLELKTRVKLDGPVTGADLDALDAIPDRWRPAVEVQCGVFRGLRYGGDDDGLHMVWWRLACGPVMLRAFFNGLPRHAAVEVAQVEAMLATLRLETQIA